MPMKVREGGVQGWARRVPAGSLIVDSAGDSLSARKLEWLSIVERRPASAPVVGDRQRRSVPRVAMYTTWSSTEKPGWVRLAFDRWEIPYDLITRTTCRPARTCDRSTT
jgi:hypothetical protein